MEELDRLHELRVGNEAVVEPREYRVRGDAFEQPLQLARDRVDCPDQHQSFGEDIRHLSASRVEQPLEEPERFEPRSPRCGSDAR